MSNFLSDLLSKLSVSKALSPEEQFIRTCCKGDLNQVRNAIRQNPALVKQRYNGETLFQAMYQRGLAVRNPNKADNSFRIIQLLLEKDAELLSLNDILDPEVYGSLTTLANDAALPREAAAVLLMAGKTKADLNPNSTFFGNVQNANPGYTLATKMPYSRIVYDYLAKNREALQNLLEQYSLHRPEREAAPATVANMESSGGARPSSRFHSSLAASSLGTLGGQPQQSTGRTPPQ